MAEPPAIRTDALSKNFGSRRVLHRLELEVASGECLGLLGGNGAGKSTLLRLLAGSSRPAAGSVALFGVDAHGDDARTIRRRLGFVGHEGMVYRDLSPRENLEVFARLYGCDEIDADALLARVGLGRVGKRATRTLSRGMLQRLALARATLHEPDLLLLDEPFTGLDESGTEMLRELLRAHHARGGTILLISHALSEIAALCTRVVVLARGRLCAEIQPVPEMAELRTRYRKALAEAQT
ncbi:MAG: heme ABC exporter ATP-binding protein CcmA [Deltaproteobacteria bacterium]